MYFEVEASLVICKITCPAKSLLMNFNAGDETKQTVIDYRVDKDFKVDRIADCCHNYVPTYYQA